MKEKVNEGCKVRRAKGRKDEAPAVASIISIGSALLLYRRCPLPSYNNYASRYIGKGGRDRKQQHGSSISLVFLQLHAVHVTARQR